LTSKRPLRWVAVAGVVLVAVLALTATGGEARAERGSGPYRNGLVAFVRCCGLPAAGIYVIRPNGSGERQIYRAAADDAPLDPAWSPDGRRIAFVPGAPRGGVWVMQASGAKRHRIVAGKGDSLFPSWSPNGRSIVFADLGPRSSGRHDLYLARASGGGLKRLTHAVADESRPAWAPNGGEIVYDRGRDLWRMRPDGSRQRLLARNASGASWSPGGSHIAFVRGGDPWVMARDGRRARRVTHLRAAQLSVAWSPDSRWLVTAPVDRGDLLLVRTNGTDAHPLTHQGGAFHAWPSWQRLRG
jgi:TolB protein